MIEDTEIAAVLSSQIPVEKAGQTESASGIRTEPQDVVQARTNLKITYSAK